MNYMEKIAEMLGVELGEKFKMIDTKTCSECDCKYYIDNSGFYSIIDSVSYGDRVGLQRVLNGRYKVVRLPWKPKSGACVYYIDKDGDARHEVFYGALGDLAIYKLGKFYHTREEAEAHAEEDKAYWESIRRELEE